MSESIPNGIRSSAVLLPDGWTENVAFYWDESGRITRLTADGKDHDLPVAPGPIVPGMINLHSHAFQRGMTGRTQRFETKSDDFWSWRDAMYAYLPGVGPDELRTEAERLYFDMLNAGYTSVCEFHYVHHDVNGNPYPDPDLLSHAIIEAARSAGIGLTLLPVLYEFGGFGRQSADAGQRRFVLSLTGYLNMIERLLENESDAVRIGYAPHSLRAVSEESLSGLLKHRERVSPEAPIHMHISEQTAEVDECIRVYGDRPVNWLLNTFAVDGCWCLVHATHIDETELEGLIHSHATVGLCPTTEADLGDGIFPLSGYGARGGDWGIGSDSNVCVNPFEELRLLEFIQRVTMRRRNIDGSINSVGAGTRRYQKALTGGRKASGRPVGRLEPGSFADFIILDSGHTLLSGKSPDEQLNSLVFSGDASQLSAVFVRGRKVTR